MNIEVLNIKEKLCYALSCNLKSAPTTNVQSAQNTFYV